ncbi:MAG: Mov34/MPN/PAD-1 family protein [Desulfobacterium sp.]|nr:Mov34/MPN/PAD-1 family protein [Desulfobacterium sp.]
MEIWISQEAVGTAIAMCYRNRSDNETGGVWVGPKEHKGVITDLIPSTAFAETSPVTYFQTARDVNILNNKLREFQKQGLDFKGYYHKHPSGMHSLSTGDKNTCWEILESPNYKINNYLVMSIITESRVQDFPLFTYVTSLIKGRKVSVKAVQYGILPRNVLMKFTLHLEDHNKETEHENHDSRQDCRPTENDDPSRPLRSDE